jgi:hypothetical protein
VLFNEQTFLDAIEHSRWCAYPLGLALVTEVVEGVLSPFAADRLEQLGALRSLALSVFDRYPVPPSIGEAGWSEARAELARRIDLIGLHPRKRVIDIPVPWAQTYFDMMPIHKELRGRDFPTTVGYLKVTLCNVHEELVRQTDLPAVAKALAPPQE